MYVYSPKVAKSLSCICENMKRWLWLALTMKEIYSFIIFPFQVTKHEDTSVTRLHGLHDNLIYLMYKKMQ